MNDKSNSKRAKRGSTGRQRHISVRAVRRSEPDVHRLGRALVAYALQEAAAEAAAEAQADAAADAATKQSGEQSPRSGRADV